MQGGTTKSAGTVPRDTIIVYILPNVVFESNVLEIDPFRGCCDHAARRNILATLGNFVSWSMGLSGHLHHPN